MDLKKVETIKPFTRFLMTIGELPSSYLVSMTYEEQLLWFCNFLQNTVIPTVNNNAAAVIELQQFVSSYFENLDVQEEINNKLDDMAESGELTEIIAEYLQLAALFCYDTVSAMAASENLDDGSSVYCLGKLTYNDGKGAFYKIREITESDVPDGDNIVSITNNVNLVAEKLPNYDINEITSLLDTLTTTTIPSIEDDINIINNTTIPGIEDDINTINNTTIPGIQDDINTINNTTIPAIQSDINIINNTTIPAIEAELASATSSRVKSLVVIGDSYGIMDGVTNFCNYLRDYLGLDNSHFYNKCEHGAAFIRIGAAYKTFNELAQELETDLSLDRRNQTTHVLIAGGYNDQNHTLSDIVSAEKTCINTVNSLFPNAQIYVAHIGWSTLNQDFQGTFNAYYQGAAESGIAKFIVNSQNILTGNLMNNTDYFHPNNNGFKELGRNLAQGLKNGSCYPMQLWNQVYDSGGTLVGVAQQNNDLVNLELYDYSKDITGTADGTEITLYTLRKDSMISGHNNFRFIVPCTLFNLTGSPLQHVVGIAEISIVENVVKCKPYALSSDGESWFSYTRINLIHNIINIQHNYS